tara:strand:- start:2251 stop:2499 length:249 start_codon:yes stop_codon:yes gene_type:complete
MGIEYYLQVLAVFSVLGGVLFVAYRFSLHYKQRIFSGDLKLIDRLVVDKGVSLVLVKHRESVFFLGISQKNISTIKEISLSS